MGGLRRTRHEGADNATECLQPGVVCLGPDPGGGGPKGSCMFVCLVSVTLWIVGARTPATAHQHVQVEEVLALPCPHLQGLHERPDIDLAHRHICNTHRQRR